MTFTFFLDDGSIHEAKGADAPEAFRILCAKLNRSWAELRTHVVDVLAPEMMP